MIVLTCTLPIGEFYDVGQAHNPMKLRIHDNSIRLRLSRTEVELFAATGHILEALEFGDLSDFTYVLEASESQKVVSATHTAHIISITVPHHLAQEWTSTDLVSISGAQPLPDGRELQILIEKDFKCIHKSAEGDEDAYPNPMASTANPL
jgi:hypothetical protein